MNQKQTMSDEQVMEEYSKKSAEERFRDLEEVRLTLRLPRGLHTQLTQEAKDLDISLNSLMVFALIDHVSPGTLMLTTKEERAALDALGMEAKARIEELAAQSGMTGKEAVERWRRGEFDVPEEEKVKA